MATSTADRTGTLAKARNIRMSASKARIVLDLIRGKHVAEAIYILEFSDRLASEPVLKVLRSAIANAVNNDELDEEELFISECYADGGPTLKRFRPRARGRAGRIQKKTCHITMVVSRLSDEDLDSMREREELKAESSPKKAKKSDAAARRDRVAKSKKAAADTDVVEDDTVENEAVEEVAADEEAPEVEPVDEVVEETDEEDVVSEEEE